MHATGIKTISVTLELDDLEATWLKSVMQNSLTQDESETDKTMRKSFWKALDEAGVKTV